MCMASRWQRFLSVTAVVVALAAAGCKTGTSWNAKPSWWSFGGSGETAEKLASAPPASTDVTKPSATSKPYPTTSTPEGYSLAGTPPAADGTGQVALATASTAAEPAAVTYGSTPPASAATAAAPAAQQGATTPAAGGLTGISPQVGPYRGAAGTPADAPLPSASAAAAPAFAPQTEATTAAVAPAAAFGATAPTASLDPPASSAARVADARSADGWSAAPTTPGSRYGDASSSRFSGASPATPASAAPFGSAPPPPADMPAPPATMPPANLPAAPATPTRRPDPGYRPGGTSSYRPSRTILAGDAPADPSPVRQVSFEAPMPPESAPVIR
ncbi:MAG: hypothetical protein ACKOC8_10340 [Pirellulales bacterium]